MRHRTRRLAMCSAALALTAAGITAATAAPAFAASGTFVGASGNLNPQVAYDDAYDQAQTKAILAGFSTDQCTVTVHYGQILVVVTFTCVS